MQIINNCKPVSQKIFSGLILSAEARRILGCIFGMKEIDEKRFTYIAKHFFGASHPNKSDEEMLKKFEGALGEMEKLDIIMFERDDNGIRQKLIIHDDDNWVINKNEIDPINLEVSF